MPYHKVEQGEFLARIAVRFGFDDWRTIYDAPQNSDFRRCRPNPNVIYPGDRLFIPENKTKEVVCETGRKHVFVIKQVLTSIKIFLKDEAGNALKGVGYKLEAGGVVHRGKTGENGMVHHDIPATATDGTLMVEELGLGWKLKIGHLDPVHEEHEDVPILSGVLARLKNLGYYEGDPQSEFDDCAREAVRMFQKTALQRDEADGELDRQTRNALRDEHGS